MALRVNMKKILLTNSSEKKFSFTFLCTQVAVLALSLVACVPTVQRIYHAPVVVGQVIELNRLTPIEGALVQHENTDTNLAFDNIIEAAKNKIFSNKQGEYHLPSISSVEAVVLMPGYAVAHYPVRISAKNNSALVFVSASLFMRDEETTTAPQLILDTDPMTIANTPPGDYLDYKTLHTYLYPHSNLGMCDLGIGGDAIASLNTARKLYWRHKDEPKIPPGMLDVAYLNVQNIWQYFYDSCDFGKDHTMERRDNIFAVRKITDKIEKEVSDLTNRQ